MSTFVLTLDLRDDPEAVAEYRRHHQSVWPEVERSLLAAGVRGMDIHLLGRRLVMVLDLVDGLDPASVFAAHARSSPRVAEWEALMRSFQRLAPEAAPGEWWARMEPVYRLRDHAARATDAAGSLRRS
jgi:L-rhamnose mutarotase